MAAHVRSIKDRPLTEALSLKESNDGLILPFVFGRDSLENQNVRFRESREDAYESRQHQTHYVPYSKGCRKGQCQNEPN